MTIIGWNCRSFTKDKQSYIEHITEDYKLDVVIIVETLRKDEIKLLNDYEVYQTLNAPHQGICIIAKKD